MVFGTEKGYWPCTIIIISIIVNFSEEEYVHMQKRHWRLYMANFVPWPSPAPLLDGKCGSKVTYVVKKREWEMVWE